MPQSANTISTRDLVTPNALILNELASSTSVNFTYLLKNTNLPARTISLKLRGLKEKGWIEKVNGNTSGGSFYSLSDSFKKESLEYLNILTNLITKIDVENTLSNSDEIKIVCFDLDGVIFEKPKIESDGMYEDKVAKSTWDLVFKKLDIYDIHETYKKLFARKQITNHEWTEMACNSFKLEGLRKDDFEYIINNRKYSKGVKKLVKELKNRRIKMCIITGSFDSLANRAKEELEIDHYLAHCKLLFNDKGYLDDWVIEESDYEHKARFLEKLVKKYGINIENCLYIGDDVNDLHAFKKAGKSVAFNTDKISVIEAVDKVIEGDNLYELIDYINNVN